MGNSCTSSKNKNIIKANKLKHKTNINLKDVTLENSTKNKFNNNLEIESKYFTLERKISDQIQLPSEDSIVTYERKISDQIQVPKLNISLDSIVTLEKIKIFNFENFENFQNPNQSSEIPSFDENSSPTFFGHFSFRNFLERKFSDFAFKFFEELNKSRTNFLEFSVKLENYLRNFDSFEENIKKLKNKNYFLRTKEDFIKAIDFFKDLHERNIKLKGLELKEELIYSFSENHKENFDRKCIKESLKKIKNKSNHKLNFIDCHLNHNEPEISFILYITDRIKRNKCERLFSSSSRYVGLNSKTYSDENVILCLVLAG